MPRPRDIRELLSWLSPARAGPDAEPSDAEPEPADLPPASGLELGMQAFPDRPVKAPVAEVRFGLVLYGGVSLAIYIYGVTFEFWRLVLASQGARKNAYADLLGELGVTATVDIVSGTSAGGINGILLAKALTTGADLRAVKYIWTDEANLKDLLHSRSDRRPRSLLRTDTFEDLLRTGLAKMDRAEGDRVPLVRAFDLFVSATRLTPWIRDFSTDLGGRIRTAEYRKAFQLKHRVGAYNPKDPGLGYLQRDFSAANNGFLMQIARATSAFPGAFEPRLIKRGDAPPGSYREGEPAESYFSDGGILHNKPFTETISTVVGRASDVPVERWLVSVEPDPEKFAAQSGEEPEVDDVLSKAAFGIPRYQSVAADLDLLVAQRERARRERELLAGVDAQIAERLAADQDSIDGIAEPFRSSPTYGAYRSERTYQLSADLSVEIATAAGLDAPRTGLVAEALRAGLQSVAEAEEQMDYSVPDLSFERRRIYNLLGRLKDRRRKPEEEPAAVRDAAQTLWARFDAIGGALWVAVNEGDTGVAVRALHGLDREADVRAATIDLMPELWQALIGAVAWPDPVAAACASLDRVYGLEAGDRLGYLDVYRNYELWDQFLLPCDPAIGVPPRDDINLARISPEDATYISKSAEDKVAGDALFHFGGFLKKDWRENDILWGRLDAAEVIVRMLAKNRGLDDERIEHHIARVQRQVISDELPKILPNYRKYMESEYGVGSEGLGDVPMGERAGLVVKGADVLRNMLRGLADARSGGVLGSIYGWLGSALALLLMILRWPVLAIWGDDPAWKRAGGLIVLFIGAWTALTFVLVLTGVIEPKSDLWSLLALGAAIFFAWSLLQLVFLYRRLTLLLLALAVFGGVLALVHFVVNA